MRYAARCLLLSFGLLALLYANSCNKDGEIVQKLTPKPTIELDSEDGVYVVKRGRELQVTPIYTNAEGAVYTWTCGGRVLSRESALRYRFEAVGTYYVTLLVEVGEERATEELRVDVQELAPPLISVVEPPQGFNFLAGQEITISPDIQNGEGASYLWTLNGEKVGTSPTYTFLQQSLGEYELKLEVANEDGKSEKVIAIRVVEKLPVKLAIPSPSRFADENARYVEFGRTLFLRAYVLMEVQNPTYRWSLNGQPIGGANGLMYGYRPASKGESMLTFTVRFKTTRTRGTLTRNVIATGENEASIRVKVICLDAAPKRAYAPGNSLHSDRVCEFVPAPGQFVNETEYGGYSGESTHEAACAYAQKRLEKRNFVSLGGFGGYIVVGFDHSVENKGGYDFAIEGNQFEGSSEPGVVWVMQDVNGNGLPDEEWYELKGSEYGTPETMQDYAVTYFRPAPNGATPWRDNKGQQGTIDRNAYHAQAYYYPLWIAEGSYTLFGTCLKPRTSQDPATKLWSNGSFGWGYADNVGSDVEGASPKTNRFKISDAVMLDGAPANLQHIDFIKVQTALNVKVSMLGEASTEVVQFTDLSSK